MIVPMKKVHIILQYKDRDEAIRTLARLGVVHIEQQPTIQTEDIKRIEDQILLINTALAVLSKRYNHLKPEQIEQKPVSDWHRLCQHLIDCEKRLEQLEEYGRSLRSTYETWKPWGDFDPQIISQLEKKSIYVHFYQIPVAFLKNLPENLIVQVVFQRAGLAYCVVIAREKVALNFEEKTAPKMSLRQMEKRLAIDEHTIENIKKEIISHLTHLQALKEKKHFLEKELELYKAANSMRQQAELAYLVGYAPFDTEALLLESARKNCWAIVITEPEQTDAVPTLIRNPRWIALIEPIFKFLDILPGYRELDISLVFLVFFSIFFGILIGDAGIGLCFLVLNFWAHKKFIKRLGSSQLFILFYILSFCAIVWGILSGTIFGQAWLAKSLRPLLPQLRNDATVQSLCFFLGALHLSIGHLWRAVLKAPSLEALSDIGWICILWAAFFLARYLVAGLSLEQSVLILFIVGSSLVIIFGARRRNILRGIGAGLGNYLLSVVNSFTDVVSYIRLFAVGLATVAVADAFNAMAADIGFSSFGSAILTALILAVGHGLNILLGPMSVLVHGVRLNVLEFCNHIDIKWSGFAYRPLRQ
ncbi:MAG: hypothetical protein N2606_00665 [Candidatus Omnitrophica bacterium]|nr:hypothetical protein [Candidatus Omnitrophota bacterium]